MRRERLRLAAGILLVLAAAAVRFLQVPEAETLRQQVAEVISESVGYREAVETMGNILSGEDTPMEVIGRALRLAFTPRESLYDS